MEKKTVSCEQNEWVVCLCHNVSVQKIKGAVAQGASSYEEVQRITGCGRSCTMCASKIKEVIYEFRCESAPGNEVSQ